MNRTPSSTLPSAEVQILGPMRPGYDEVLTPPGIEFVADLARRFGDRVEQLMARRRQR